MTEKRLRYHIGDITLYRADVIVNPSNTVLQLGAGVSGAIRRAAAPELQAEMHRFAPIPWGSVAVTEPFGLPCSYLFHAAVIDRNRDTTMTVVRACLANVFLRAIELDARSLAIPAIGAGAGGLDVGTVGGVSVDMALEFLHECRVVERLTFCFLRDDDRRRFFAVHAATILEDTSTAASDGIFDP